MRKRDKVRFSLRTLSALVLLSLLLSVVVLSLGGCGTGRISDKDALLAYIEEHPASDSARNIAVIFDTWRFPLFNAERVVALEGVFIDNYYKELPPRAELAERAARIFIDEYYDGCDLTDKEAVTDGIIRAYVAAVGDKYSEYRSPSEEDSYRDSLSGERGGIGVTVKRESEKCDGVYITEIDEGSPAMAAGLRVGDFLFEVEGVKMSEAGYTKTVGLIAGEVGSEVKVAVLRGTERIDFTLKRAIITIPSVALSTIEGDGGDVAYIVIRSFNKNTHIQFAEAIDAAEASGAVGIVFDLRVNPGGYLSTVVKMLSYLVPTGTPIASFSSDRRSEYAALHEGFEETDSVLDLPATVIVSGSTASAAELFAAALRDYNEMGILDAAVVGGITYKKGVMQNTFGLDSGDFITMTTAYYNPPSGENFDGIGVIPSILLDENDDWVSAAVEELYRIIAENDN